MGVSSFHTTFEREFEEMDLSVIAILVVFWVVLALGELFDVSLPVVRAAVAVFVLIGLPGILLANLLEVGTASFGRFAIFGAGLGLAHLAILTVAASLVLPIVGVATPLSLVPVALLVTASIAVLVAVTHVNHGYRIPSAIVPPGSLSVVFGLVMLPTGAAVAAAAMNEFQSTLVMGTFVVALVAVVLLIATGVIPRELYSFAVFFVSLATLIHRNLLTSNLIGFDIQHIAFIASLVKSSGQWTPGLGGSVGTLPVVTAVPATVATVGGIGLPVTFKTLYVLLFALVPVGIFYVGQELFDREIGIYASLFFLFNNITMGFTPGKQLISELFLILIVLAFVHHGLDRRLSQIAAVVLSIGLIFSHYGTTMVVGFSLLAGYAGLAVIDTLVDSFEHELTIWWPLLVLGGGLAWYGTVFPPLFSRIVSIPGNVAAQIIRIVETQSLITGSGSTFVAHQTTPVDRVTLLLYLCFTILLAIGLAWRTITQLYRVLRNQSPEHVEYIALSIPMFALLGASYVVVFNLWADRVYQMVLPILGVFMPLGYRLVVRTITERSWGSVPVRLGLAVLLGGLLVVNSGLAVAVVGGTGKPAFNPARQDSMFTHQEETGAVWLKTHSGIDRVRETQRPNYPGTIEGVGDTRIYTDQFSYHLFRGILPSPFYNVEVVALKVSARPEFHPTRIDQGYVFVRDVAVRSPDGRASVEPIFLSRDKVEAFASSNHVVYSNGAARVVVPGAVTVANRSQV